MPVDEKTATAILAVLRPALLAYTEEVARHYLVGVSCACGYSPAEEGGRAIPYADRVALHGGQMRRQARAQYDREALIRLRARA